VTPSETTHIRQCTRRARIAQSSALLTIADEPASPLRDVSQDDAPIKGRNLDKGEVAAERVSDDTKEMETVLTSMDAVTVLPRGVVDVPTGSGSIPTASPPAAEVPGKIVPLFDTMSVPQGEGSGTPTEPHHTPSPEAHPTSHTTHSSPTHPPITTTSIPTVTPSETTHIRQCTRRARIAQSSALLTVADEPASPLRDVSQDKGEVAAERVSDDREEIETIDAQVIRDLEEQLAREDQRMSEQVARDAEIARIHAEEELRSMIDGLDRSNETVAKYLQEYQQFVSEMPLERRIELISDLVRYQENYAKVHKFQAQQRKPWSKKQKRDYYMAVIRSNLGWKVKDFRGMTFEEIEAKFTTVWKQLEDFIPMGSKEEAERLKWKGLSLEQESVKKLKTSEEVNEEAKSLDEVPEEKVKEMMHLVPIEEVYIEALQVKHHIIDWKHIDREDLNHLRALVKESLSNMQPTSDKEMELWIELKRLYEPDDEDQLWTHTQNLIHALVEWKLYDMCGVHQGRIVGNKLHKAFPLPVIECPLAEEVSTASEESCRCKKKKEATALKISLLV
nr:hypothetical protein [Tanacetum cinerariifolium]